MSMGIPVVATDVGGNKELVEDGVTGLLVPPGNAEALAESIKRMLKTPGLAKTCSSAAQKRVRENYSIEAMVENTLSLYRELVPAR
jgi:glycosyltransferase involved in cell wall biosynthesis